MDNQKLRKKNVFKLLRTVLEVFVIVFVIVWAVWSLVSYRSEQRVLKAEAELHCAMVSSDAMRSLLFLALGCAVLVAYRMSKINPMVTSLALAAVMPSVVVCELMTMQPSEAL